MPIKKIIIITILDSLDMVCDYGFIVLMLKLEIMVLVNYKGSDLEWSK